MGSKRTLIVVGATLAGCNALSGVGDLRVEEDRVSVRAPDATSPEPGAETDGAAPAEDASREDDASPVGCDPTRPFGAPTPLAELNSPAEDEAARLSPDELTIYFDSDRGNGFEIYVATRAARTQPFGAPKKLPLQIPYPVKHPTVTADGLTIAFKATTQAAAGEIFFATRPSIASDFGTPTFAPMLTSQQDDGTPYLDPAGGVIYFASTRSGSSDLFRASLPNGAPIPVAPANSGSAENAAVASADDLTLYFASTRDGDQNVFVAKRASPNAPFGAPTAVAELATKADEAPSWVSPDGCRLYLWSTRNGTDHDLFVASR